MNQKQRKLDQIQRWMQTVISAPGGVEAGIASEEAQREIPLANDQLESVITRSSQQTSHERIGIYANAYYARLLECLSEEYAALVSAMGTAAFGAFSLQYLQKYPPASYTLGELGARFPQFLQESRPEPESNAETPDWTDFLIELATLERVYSEVFDGPGIEKQDLLTAETLNTISPEEWPDLTLQMAPCFRLMEFQFPVQEYISSTKRDEIPDIPAAQTTRLAITRRNYIVRRAAISETEYFLLSRLHHGLTVGDAISEFAEAGLLEPEQLAGQLHVWFKHWTESAYFVGVTRSNH
ncbi:MAG: putative DNA-binding domain-containing protein [Planctomycetaceae bacterium]|nr:putative DNA-binding domain-containing protein [Planctomycetaceae bacterium]